MLLVGMICTFAYVSLVIRILPHGSTIARRTKIITGMARHSDRRWICALAAITPNLTHGRNHSIFHIHDHSDAEAEPARRDHVRAATAAHSDQAIVRPLMIIVWLA